MKPAHLRYEVAESILVWTDGRWQPGTVIAKLPPGTDQDSKHFRVQVGETQFDIWAVDAMRRP